MPQTVSVSIPSRAEVYIQNNRLVSLAGLKSFKFLRVSRVCCCFFSVFWASQRLLGLLGLLSARLLQVLLASGNQLRNLDKQLALLSRSAQPSSARSVCTVHTRTPLLLRFPFLKKLELFDNPVRVGYT